jgi:hypothetical protein
MATDPLYLDLDGGLGPSYGAQEYRQGDTALLAGPSAGQVFSGVRGGVVSVVGTTITIQPLSYVLNGGNAPGSEGVYRGVFLSGDTANLSKTLTAAHATLDRIDQIRVRVYNHNLDASGRREHVIEYQAGTAGSGVGPTLPANSYEIAKINVPHSGGGAPVVVMTANPPVAAGGARPNGSGGLEIYDIVSATWKRVYESAGARFMGGYDPGVASNIANATWIPMPITAVEASSRVTLTGGNKLVINETGTYQCNGSVRVGTGTAAGTGIFARFSVNTVEKRTVPNPPTTSSVHLQLGCVLDLVAGDELRFEVYQDQGSARAFQLSTLWNRIDIARVS